MISKHFTTGNTAYSQTKRVSKFEVNKLPSVRGGGIIATSCTLRYKVFDYQLGAVFERVGVSAEEL